MKCLRGFRKILRFLRIVHPRNTNVSLPCLKSTIRVFLGMQFQTQPVHHQPNPHEALPSPAIPGCGTSPPRNRRHTESTPQATNIAPPRSDPVCSGRCSPATGEITPPCGVPASVSSTVPSSITPASSHCRISFNTLRSGDALLHQLNQRKLDRCRQSSPECPHPRQSYGPGLPRLADRFQRLPSHSSSDGIRSYTAGNPLRRSARITNFASHLDHPVPYRSCIPSGRCFPSAFGIHRSLHR